MGAKQSNPLYPNNALRADPSADDSVGEDNLSGVVVSNAESAVVPELPVDAVERDAPASDALAGNNAVCSTCPSPPQT